MHTAGAIPFVGLDFHTQRQSFPLVMALDMDEIVTEETVLDCLSSRRCHPRVFGLPLSESMIGRVLPVLGMAEGSRRMLASIVRFSRVSSRS
jgi:hypothetical protein